MKDYRETLNIVGWILTSFSTTVIVLRLYTRTRVTELGWDDWLMLLGWVSGVRKYSISVELQSQFQYFTFTELILRYSPLFVPAP